MVGSLFVLALPLPDEGQTRKAPALPESNWQGGGLLLCDLYSLSAHGALDDPGTAAAAAAKAGGICLRLLLQG